MSEAHATASSNGNSTTRLRVRGLRRLSFPRFIELAAWTLPKGRARLALPLVVAVTGFAWFSAQAVFPSQLAASEAQNEQSAEKTMSTAEKLAAAAPITIVSWGGAYAESQSKAYIEPYLATNPDRKIELLEGASEAVSSLRSQAAAGVMTWDLVDVTASDAIRLCNEGLAIEIDHDALLLAAPDGSRPTRDFGQTIISPCFIPSIVYSTTIGYRTDKLATAPSSLCDVFNLERFPGLRALEARPINNLEWALLCDGVELDNVYSTLETEDGLRRALLKLASIKDYVVWWHRGEEPAQWLSAGKVVMASAFNGRLFNVIEQEKKPVAILWDHQVFDFDGWIIPKGARNMDAALEFVRFATSTEQLAEQARYIPYGPARRSSAELVGTHAELGIEMKPHMPTSPANARTAVIYEFDWWAANRDRIDERFKTWLGSIGARTTPD